MSFDPKIIEARLALRQIGPEQMVDLACEAIEAGRHGPSVLRMAALIQPSGWEVDQLVPAFMRDAHLEVISRSEACVRLASKLASDILNSAADPLLHVKRFERLWIDADYPSSITDLGTLDDEISMQEYLGESEEQMRKMVRTRLKYFLEDCADLHRREK
jgi:hypothetical protein